MTTQPRLPRLDLWHCTAVGCGAHQTFGGDTGRTREEARRLIRADCFHDRGHSSALQLVDAVYRAMSSQRPDPEIEAEATYDGPVLGRYGRRAA